MSVLKTKRFIVPSSRVKNGSVDVEKRTLEATFSDRSVDRDGEIVLPKAFEDRIETFSKNPVVLWMHNAFDPPIGHVVELDIGDDAVTGKVGFRPEGDSQLADDVFRAFASGDLTSFSIGFRVFDMDDAEVDDDGKQTKPPTITDAELFELSAVTIPANTNAVAKHDQASALIRKGLARFLEETGEKLDDGTKLVVPVSAASGAPTYAAPISDEQVLKRAAELASDFLGRLAHRSSVPPEELRALKTLRLAFVGSSALEEGDELEEVSRHLTEALDACKGLTSGATA